MTIRVPTDHTAERLRQLIQQSEAPLPPAPSRGSPRGRLSVFVLCTSSTPADSTDIGRECYPGVIVDPDATQTAEDQPTLGKVWLTLLDGAGAGIPVADVVYECTLGGPFDPGADARPRAFSADSSRPVVTRTRLFRLPRNPTFDNPLVVYNGVNLSPGTYWVQAAVFVDLIQRPPVAGYWPDVTLWFGLWDCVTRPAEQLGLYDFGTRPNISSIGETILATVTIHMSAVIDVPANSPPSLGIFAWANGFTVDPRFTLIQMWAMPVAGAVASGCISTGSPPPPPPPITYNCVDGHCVDPQDGTGTYSSYALCALADCGPPPLATYNCVDGNCVDPGDGTGTYLSLTSCQAAGCSPPPPPPPVTYNCVDGVCVDPGDGTGAFPNLLACTGAGCTSPPPPPTATYNCVGGTCVDPGDGSGVYSTLGACTAAGCESDCCSIANGATVHLHIPDGPDAGDYDTTWNAGSSSATFALTGGLEGNLTVSCVGGIWSLGNPCNFSATSAVCGPPVSVVFHHCTGLGITGNILFHT